MANVLENLALGAGFAGINNMFGQLNANQSYRRQQKLMDKQFAQNAALQKSSAINQVEGLRMAGLNPALAGSNSGSSQSVSLGSADMAQTFPLQASDMLTLAQAENLEAQTAKLKAEAPNIEADTEKKFAERLNIVEDTQHMKNINDAYAAENRELGVQGKAMAQKWLSEPWFECLAPDTQQAIESIADGSTTLSVAHLAALDKVVGLQKNISDADRTLVRNAFDNAISSMQFSDKVVLDAIAKEPDTQRKKLDAERAKIMEEIPEIQQKVQNLISDLKTKNLTQEQMRAEIDAFKRNDLGYLKSKGEYGKWLEGYAEEALLRILPLATGGALAKPNIRSSANPKPFVSDKPYQYREIERYPDGKIKRSIKSEGVGQFRY